MSLNKKVWLVTDEYGEIEFFSDPEVLVRRLRWNGAAEVSSVWEYDLRTRFEKADECIKDIERRWIVEDAYGQIDARLAEIEELEKIIEEGT